MRTDLCVPFQLLSLKRPLTCYTFLIFDVGCIKVLLTLLQELRGNQEFRVSVSPQLAPLLGATNALPGPATSGGLADARGPLQTRARKRIAFWESIELMRLLVEVKTQCVRTGAD